MEKIRAAQSAETSQSMFWIASDIIHFIIAVSEQYRVKATADEGMIGHKVESRDKLPVTASIMIITPCEKTPVKPYRGSALGQANSSGGHDIMCGKICSARKRMSIFS